MEFLKNIYILFNDKQGTFQKVSNKKVWTKKSTCIALTELLTQKKLK